MRHAWWLAIAIVLVCGGERLARADVPTGCALPSAPAKVAGAELEAILATGASCYFPGAGHCLLGQLDRAVFFSGAYFALALMLGAAIGPAGLFVPVGVFSFLRLLVPALGVLGVYGCAAVDAFREGLAAEQILEGNRRSMISLCD